MLPLRVPLGSYAFVKLVELVFESVPESILQASVLMTSEAEDVTVLSMFSVVSSMLAAAMLMADLNFGVEASGMSAQQEPGVHPLHGYIRASLSGKLALGCTMFMVSQE